MQLIAEDTNANRTKAAQASNTNKLPKEIADLTKLTHYDGEEYSGQLSPDGNYLAFAYSNKQNGYAWHIGLQDLKTATVLVLEDDSFQQVYPVFNSDGSKLLYMAFYGDGGCDIRYIEVNEGDFNKLHTITKCQDNNLNASIAWHPNDKSIFYTDVIDATTSLTAPHQIYHIDITGENKQQISPSDMNDYYSLSLTRWQSISCAAQY